MHSVIALDLILTNGDLAVLVQDPLAIAPERIKDIPIDMTVVDGQIAFVHDAAQGLRQ